MKKPAFKNSTYFWLFLPFILPIIGGLITKARKRKEDKELADFSMMSSILNPFLVSILIGVIIGVVFPQYLTFASQTTDFILQILLGLIFSYLVLTRIMRGNKYRYFYPIYWFSIFGAILSYYKEKNETIKSKFFWFMIPILFITILVYLINTAFVTYPSTIFDETILLDVNETFTYSKLYLTTYDTLRVKLDVLDEGRINAVIFNSTEYDNYLSNETDEVYFYDIGSTIKSISYEFIPPVTDTYFVTIGNGAFIEEQGESVGKATVKVVISVY